MSGAFSVPEQYRLSEFFGTGPVEHSSEDGYWCYEASDNRSVALRFSFNLFEQSVQTALRVAGIPLSTVSHEGAQEMSISSQALICRFSYDGAEATLVVRISDSISVEWSSLRTR